jgi:hypothetical protein
LSGTAPGLLDPSQPYRLLPSPTSQLTFASFLPQAARGNRQQSASSSSAIDSHTRIVIEHTRDGNFWRYVPMADHDDGAAGEIWPRLVSICG